MFEPEAILDRRKNGRKWEVKIRWAGYGPDHDSWEPATNFNKLDVYKEFMKQNKKTQQDNHVRNS